MAVYYHGLMSNVKIKDLTPLFAPPLFALLQDAFQFFMIEREVAQIVMPAAGNCD